MIHIFRDCHSIAKKNFALGHHTIKHAPSNLDITYREAGKLLAKLAPFTADKDRTTSHDVVDAVNKGFDLLLVGDGTGGAEDDEVVELEADEADLTVDAL